MAIPLPSFKSGAMLSRISPIQARERILRSLRQVAPIAALLLSACSQQTDKPTERIDHGDRETSAHQVAQSAAVYNGDRRIADFEIDPAIQYYLMTIQMSCELRNEFSPVLFRVDTSVRSRRIPIGNIPTLFWEITPDGRRVRIESEPTLRQCYISAWQPVRDECREARC